MGMEGGWYGRFASKIWGFYCWFPSVWADFLPFVYRGVDCAPAAWGADALEFSGVIHA